MRGIDTADIRIKIADKTVREIGIFLTELRYRTRNHQIISSVTKQMTNDYANRFIIELLQNGHDAISKASQKLDSPNDAVPGKIKIILKEYDKRNPILYFANTGLPFSESNFEAISNLALSDKDPSESIGNKGIGFKSVLQVCKTPQIYSGYLTETDGFDGFCFEFNPSKVHRLAEYIIRFIETREVPTLEGLLQYPVALVDWGHAEIEAFHKAIEYIINHNSITDLNEYIEHSLSHLSPYQLPFPISTPKHDEVLRNLGEEGFVSVVKLELTEEGALDTTIQTLQEIDLDSWIFLSHLAELTIVHDIENANYLTKQMSKNTTVLGKAPCEVKRIEMDDSSLELTKDYLLFSRVIGGKNDPENQQRILQAVKSLNGKWKKLDSAKLEIAVPISSKQQKGKMYIYLPTKQPNDFAFHINAPFFGQMNRKNIDHTLAINELLLKETAVVILYAVDFILQNRPKHCEDMLVDLICFHRHAQEIPAIIIEELTKLLGDKSIQPKEWNVLAYRNQSDELSFGAINHVYCLPDDWDYEAFSATTLSKILGIRIATGISTDRIETIERFAEYVNLSAGPKEQDFANWAEWLAENSHEQNASIDDWQKYYDELVDIVEYSSSLSGRKVLLGEDGELHLGGGNEDCETYVFFPPVQGNEESRKNNDANSKLKIPSFLSNKIAFLNSNLQLYKTDKGTKGRRKSEINDFFRNSSQPLVKDFQIDTILATIIVPEMPNEIVSYKTEKSRQLMELLQWVMSLYFGSSQSLLSSQKRFQQLYLPCRGGWYQATDSYFSGDWEQDTRVEFGELLTNYFTSFNKGPYEVGLQKQLLHFDLLPEFITIFGKEKLANFFKFCGTADYLRLVPAVPEAKVKVRESNYRFTFPEYLNGKLLDLQRQYYKKEIDLISGAFVGPFQYELRNFMTIEGLERYEDLTPEGRIAFSKLMMVSLPKWDNWETTTMKKIDGNPWNPRVPSLVKVTLENLNWIPVGKESDETFVKPSESWYVHPDNLRSGSYSYSFISYITFCVAQIISQEDTLSELEKLNLSSFNPKTSIEAVRLLNELAEKLETGNILPELMNHFKHHYRNTWQRLLEFFQENENDFSKKLAKIVVSKGGSLHVVKLYNRDVPVYLPDDPKRLLELRNNSNIDIIFVDHGKRFITMFENMFGSEIARLSNLEQKIYVDHQLWTDDSAKECTTYLFEDEREWLLPFIVTVAIYREDSGLSVGSKRFSEICAILKLVKMKQVGLLERCLFTNEDSMIDNASEQSVLHRDTNTVLFAETCANPFEELAVCVRELLQIIPLELSLKYAFSKLGSSDLKEPEAERIIQALEANKISLENYETVKRMMNEDLQWVIEMMLPTIVTFLEDKERILQTLLAIPLMETESAFHAYISELLPDQYDVSAFIQLAKESNSIKEMGYRLYMDYGIQLSKWNAALESFGGKYNIVMNDELSGEFEVHKKVFSNLVICFIRHLVNYRVLTIEDYLKIKQDYENLGIADSIVTQLWRLGEFHFYREISAFLESYSIDLESLAIFRLAMNRSELESWLGENGVSLTNYLETSKANALVLKECLKNMQHAVVILTENKDLALPSYWTQSEQILLEEAFGNSPKEVLELKEWTQAEAYQFILQSEKVRRECPPDWCSNVHKVEELIQTILESKAQHVNPESKLAEEREKNLRKKRLVTINGQEFDTEESNLIYLGKIMSSFDYDSMENIGAFDQPIALEEVKVSKRPSSDNGANQGNKKCSSPPRHNKRMENVIGVAGELILYHYLKKYHENFTPENWKSENSRLEFPGKTGNDSLGYDFEVIKGNITYHVEVKTTVRNEFKFEMGSTETTRARNDAKYKNTKYVIAFIMNPFNEPRIHWLPNPYAENGNKFYTIEDVGARLKFKL